MKRDFVYLIVGLLVIGVAVLWIRSAASSNPGKSIKTDDNFVAEIVRSEDLLLELTVPLKKLSHATAGLKVPDEDSGKLFASTVNIDDVIVDEIPATKLTDAGHSLELKPSRAVPREQLTIWPELFAGMTEIRNAKFYLVKGKFDDQNPNAYKTLMNFRGLGTSKTGESVSIQASMDVTWCAADIEAASGCDLGWEITDWKTKKVQLQSSSHSLFKDVTDQLITDPADREHILKAQQEIYLKQMLGNEVADIHPRKYVPYFMVALDGWHPGLSVVDIDGDGIDELYICDEWKTNQLIKQTENGFEDVAAEYGLDVDGTSTSAIFADFDNDGDKDVIIGRFLDRALYLINDGGQYKEMSASDLGVELPYFVSSISCADYNSDGLLDIYLCTYAFPGGKIPIDHWTKKFLSPEATKIVNYARKEIRRYINEIGPPNVFLKNRGNGKFAHSSQTSIVDLNHNTLQSTWSDFDLDGDQDLYISNDFAPDFLFRNEDGKFTDVTRELGGDAMMGFGMGSSFGDYDLDGDIDLYISNMYSKAGLRITEQIPGIDERFVRSADGNRLFRQVDGKFELASTEVPYEFAAAKAGWAWGGQMADFTNDGYLDIYSSSGYYTAPKEHASDKDL